MALGTRGSGTEQHALQILAANGIGVADLRVAERVPFAAAADHLRAGDVDVALFQGARGDPVVAEALAFGRLELLSVGQTANETLERKYPFYTMGEIPAKTYKGHDREPALPRGDGDAGGARRPRGGSRVSLYQGGLRQPTPVPCRPSCRPKPHAADRALPLHPGAQRFFKENGIAR